MLLDSFGKDIAAAGTAEALSSASLYVSEVTVRAKASNTGNVYVGGTDVDNTKAPLAAGDAISFASGVGDINLASVYVDVDTNGEGVWVHYKIV